MYRRLHTWAYSWSKQTSHTAHPKTHLKIGLREKLSKDILERGEKAPLCSFINYLYDRRGPRYKPVKREKPYNVEKRATEIERSGPIGRNGTVCTVETAYKVAICP